MKILIVNDSYIQGGAEIQVRDEIKTLTSKGNECFLLTFDLNQPTGFIENNVFNYKIANNNLCKFFNKFFLNKKYYKKVQKILLNFKPDYIHIHNCKRMTKSINYIIKKYSCKIIKTFHDYGYVCPKGTCIKNDGIECPGIKSSNCNACFKNKIKMVIKKYEIKNNLNWINKNISTGLSPSNDLKLKLETNDYNINLKSFPNVYNGNYLDYKLKINHDFLFCGIISENKGVTMLLDYFEKNKNLNLTLIGLIDSKYEQYFTSRILKTPNVTYLGRLTHDEVVKIYQSKYCLIVPSLWLENYPNVILESIFSGTLCIGSSRGGIPQMLGNQNLLFDPLDINSLGNTIEYVLNISDKEYESIVKSIYERLKQYNSAENFYNMFNELLDSEK